MNRDERDDNGLTRTESATWRAQYTTIGELISAALASAPSTTERRRRLGLLRLELATQTTHYQPEMTGDTWQRKT